MLTKSFHRLWLSQALSTLGDIWYILALVVTLYNLSGSAFITALYPLLRSMGMTVGSIVAPVITPKFRLSHLLTICLRGQTIGLSLLAAYILLYSHERLSIVLLVSMVFFISILEGIAGPVRSSLIPLIVPEASLLQANGFLNGVIQTCSLAGWALGAIIVSWLGAGLVVVISALLLGAAWIIASLIRKSETAILEVSPPTSWWSSIHVGWQHYFRVPKLRLLFWMNIWEGLFGAVFAGAFLLVFVGERLHAEEIWWGWINGAYLGGFVIFSLLVSRLPGQIQNLGRMLLIGSGGYAIITFGFSYTSIPILALSVMLILGAAQSVKDLAERTLIQTSVPSSELPPIFAAQSSLISLLYGVSLLLCGWIGDTLGIQVLYVFAAGSFAISFAGAAIFIAIGDKQRQEQT